MTIDDPLANMKRGWWSFELPGYRDHPKPTTYSMFDYEALPPVNAPIDTACGWLAAQPRQGEWSLAENSYPDGSKTNFASLRPIIAQIQFELPRPFINFIETPLLHERVRSCTGSMLEFSNYLVRTSNPLNGVIIQFLVDQQGCLRWYLFADACGNQAVLVSGEMYGLIIGPDEVPCTYINLFEEDIWFCAPTFTDFIYRYWLENEIFFKLMDDEPNLTDLQHDYLNHYNR